MSAAWPGGNLHWFVKLRPSGITAETLVAGVQTWKRVTSPASYFCRSF